MKYFTSLHDLTNIIHLHKLNTESKHTLHSTQLRTDDEDVVEAVYSVDLAQQLVHDAVRHARAVTRGA